MIQERMVGFDPSTLREFAIIFNEGWWKLETPFKEDFLLVRYILRWDCFGIGFVCGPPQPHAGYDGRLTSETFGIYLFIKAPPRQGCG